MSKVVVHNVAVSIDGYSAGLDQDINNPLGVNGPDLMAAFFETKTFHQQHGLEGGEEGIDSVGLGTELARTVRATLPLDPFGGPAGDTAGTLSVGEAAAAR